LTRTLLVFALLPLTLMGGALYLRARELLLDTQAAQTQRLLSTQLAGADQAIHARLTSLSSLVRQPEFAALIDMGLAAGREDAAFGTLRGQILDAFAQLNAQPEIPTFSHLLLLDQVGTVRISSNESWEGLSVAGTPTFESIVAGEQSALAFSLKPLYDEQLALLTAVGRRNEAGTFLGAVIGVTESESLAGILHSLLDMSPNALAFFVVPPASLLTTDIYTDGLTAMDASGLQAEQILAALDALRQPGQTDAGVLRLEMADGIILQAHLQWMPGLNAGVGLAVPQEDIYGPLAALLPFIVALVSATLVVMGLIISIGTNRAMRPLRILTDITARFAAGDWSGRAPASGTRNEVGRLATSFNHMADELSNLYRSLEQQVEERTRQVRMAAAIAQNLTGLSDLDALLAKTVELLVKDLGFHQASIFMLDPAGRLAVLRAAHGPSAERLLGESQGVEVGAASLIGWVSQHNASRVAAEASADPMALTNGLQPGIMGEAALPISVGEAVLGVLDVQSKAAGAFSPETIVMLQTLTSQIAAAIQNVGLVAASSSEFQDLARLFRATRDIASARDEERLFEMVSQVLREAPHPVVLVGTRELDLEILALADAPNVVGATVEFQRYIRADLPDLDRFLAGGSVIVPVQGAASPLPLQHIAEHLGFTTVGYVPLRRAGKLAGVIILGAKQRGLTTAAMEPYTTLGELISVTLGRLADARAGESRLTEAQALASLSQAVGSSGELQDFFAALQLRIRDVVGDLSFSVVRYDSRTNTLRIPYIFDGNERREIDALPLGEGLTSIVIRSGQPLILVEDTERRAAESETKFGGRLARSWMGAPMLHGDQVIGALVVQDPDEENAFTSEHLHFLTSLAAQSAGVISNARLLDESIHRSVRLETAAEIARDISASLDLGELLAKAVALTRERFDFYHAAVFLLDSTGEFAVIREASGEAGAQLKRLGHKIGVGSKSIVGFAAGRGEQLVLNDTAQDATYLPNPILPDTRSEAAIPLRVGDRILGVLDVQSTRTQAFAEDDLRSLQILADQLAVAVVNTELFAETQEHLAQHRLLHHITTAAASGTTLEEALQGAVRGLQVTMGGDRVSILLADRARRELHIQAIVGYSEEVSALRIPFGTGITGWVAAHRRPLLVNNVGEDSRYIAGSPNTQSELAVPLIYRNDVLGVLNVESEQANAYTQSDEEMLGTLGGSLAAIIANARLLEQIRERAERERLVYEITSKIRRSTDIESILATTATELMKAMGSVQTRIQVTARTAETNE
jgi:GAF domain-containing protein/HAMP domain-containing protein